MTTFKHTSHFIISFLHGKLTQRQQTEKKDYKKSTSRKS